MIFKYSVNYLWSIDNWWITFSYYTGLLDDPWEAFMGNDIINKYQIIDIIDSENNDVQSTSIQYIPYQISCTIWRSYSKLILIIRVNDHKDYCFESNQKNCRLMEMSESSCESLKNN